MSTPLLSVKDLTVQFRTSKGPITAVDGINLRLDRGEVLGIIGESGSGKSVTMRALLRILPEKKTTISGDLRVDGTDVLGLRGRALAAYRGGEVSMVFQEPATALDPVFTIGAQITEAVRRHRKVSRAEAEARALEMLELVRIPSPQSRLGNYPHEMSGGMRQRAMIALALAAGPKLLLADEPTTALDATVQIQVILLLRDLQRDMGMATIFVTHDVGVAAEISDRIAVMYAGRIVETGTASEVLKSPRHPYTRGLLSSTVHGGKPRANRSGPFPACRRIWRRCRRGVPLPRRCPLASAACEIAPPPLRALEGQRQVACLRSEETV